MLGLALITGMVGGLEFGHTLKPSPRAWPECPSFLFSSFDPFINFVEMPGFKALAVLLQPLVDIGGRGAVVISGGLIGAFGIASATVAELKMLHFQ